MSGDTNQRREWGFAGIWGGGWWWSLAFFLWVLWGVLEGKWCWDLPESPIRTAYAFTLASHLQQPPVSPGQRERSISCRRCSDQRGAPISMIWFLSIPDRRSTYLSLHPKAADPDLLSRRENKAISCPSITTPVWNLPDVLKRTGDEAT